MNEPRTLTEAIDRVRAALIPLPWTDVVQKRASLQQQLRSGQSKPQLLPMVHVGNGEYLDCRPNDEYKSVLFITAQDPEKNDFNRAKHSPTHAIRAERAVTLIGWANLEQLPEAYRDPTGFPELIKVELKAKLKWVSCVIRIGEFQDGPLNVVYKPFIVSDLDRRYDTWPFVCFRQELTLMTIER